MNDTPAPQPSSKRPRQTREGLRNGPAQPGSSAQRAATGRASDKDLALKVAIRRLLWRMGCSTRLDVRLRAYVPERAGKSPAQDLTDLDVLGIGFTPGGQLHTTFADCRSSEGRALERMFWVRGVADFVAADDAFLVRAHDVPPAVRTLAGRLSIGILTPADFAAMETTFPTNLNLTDGPLACLFNRESAGLHLDAHNNADRKLRRLLNYLEFDYWIYEPHRNTTQLVAHLSDVVAILDPANRQHRTLFYDCVWHYALTAARAAAFVRSTRMGAVPTAVETYVAGGELALREKAGLAQALESAGWPVSSGVVQPPYLQAMTELINRYLIRPTETAHVLRYAEYLAVSEVNREPASVAALQRPPFHREWEDSKTDCQLDGRGEHSIGEMVGDLWGCVPCPGQLDRGGDRLARGRDCSVKTGQSSRTGRQTLSLLRSLIERRPLKNFSTMTSLE